MGVQEGLGLPGCPSISRPHSCRNCSWFEFTNRGDACFDGEEEAVRKQRWEGAGKRKMEMSVEIRVEHELDSQEVSECLLNALLFCS